MSLMTNRSRSTEQTEILTIDPNWDLERCEQTRLWLQEQITEIDEALNRIKDQIGRARDERWQHGTYADADWWRRVNSAQRHRARQRQAYQTAYGEINRRIKDLSHYEREKGRERAFIRHAQQMLPAEMYAAIWAQVIAEIGPAP